MELSNGLLRIRAFSASEAIPIEGVNVLITGNGEVSGDIVYSTETDMDGLSKTVKLPTPSIAYSLNPNPKEQPYSTYDIKATKDGYQDKTILNVAIFADREAILPINMIPTDMNDYPLGNSTSRVSENEDLE